MKEREALVNDNIRLVHSCAQRFKGRGIEYDELFSAGCLGLVKASKCFDFSRGLCFSTYAVPVILGEIRRLFRDGGTVKVSRSLKELSQKVNKIRQQISVELGREPTVNELAEKMGLDSNDIAEALNASMSVLSLTQDSDDGGGQTDIAVPNHEEEISDKLALDEVMKSLEERDRKLIVLRYFQSRTQNDTAKVLGMTQVQVSRREKVILNELRRKLTG